MSDVDITGFDENITDIDLFNADITTIHGITKYKNLKSLNVSSNALSNSDIEEISELESLEMLCMADIAPTDDITLLKDPRVQFDFTPLSKLTNLRQLDLSGNNIKDISFISPLINLTDLTLMQNYITKLEPLDTLINLQKLNLGINRIKKISALSSLTHLIELDLSMNKISNLKPLATLRNIIRLDLESNRNIKDLSPIGNLTNLEYLSIVKIGTDDISPLGRLKNSCSLYFNIDELVCETYTLRKIRRIFPYGKINLNELKKWLDKQ